MEIEFRRPSFGSPLPFDEETEDKLKDNSGQIIKLNIGGTKFETTKSTLMFQKKSYFYCLLSSDKFKPDKNGEYFIDRSPDYFPDILYYLRTELDFYQIEMLNEVDQIEYDKMKKIKVMSENIVSLQNEKILYERHHHSKETIDQENIVESEQDETPTVEFQNVLEKRLFENHKGKFENLTELKDGRLAFSSGDYIKIFNIFGYYSEMLLVCEGIICFIEWKDGIIASGHSDYAIRIWDSDGYYRQRFSGHTGYIRSLLKLDDKRIISGSDDGTIRFWNESGECTKCIKANNPIRYLGLFSDGNRIVSSDSLQCLKIWDQKGTCKKSVDINGLLSFIILSNDTIAVGVNDSTIKIFDDDANILKTFGNPEENYRENKVIELPDGRIASCLYYSYFNHFYCLRIWHKNRSTEEKNIQIHSYY
eukprot:gene4346-7702_t